MRKHSSMYLPTHHALLLFLSFIPQLAVAAVLGPQTPSNSAVAAFNSVSKTRSSPDAALSPRRIQKRHRRRPTGCPAGYIPEYSYCQPVISSRAYQIICVIMNRTHMRGWDTPWRIAVVGDCHPDEICLWTTIEKPPIDTAFCVSLDSMAQYTIDTNDKNKKRRVSFASSQIGLPSDGGAVGSHKYALEAALTGSDTGLSLNVSSLRLQAQKAVDMHGQISYQTLPGGTGFCTNCARLSVDLVPPGTQNVAVDMVLEQGTQVGNLFLGALEL